MSEARVVPFFDISKIPDVEDTSREEILRLHRVLRIAVVEYADSFTATGSGYGPVSNLFLATTSDNTGILIATAVLSAPITFTNSSSVNMRMRLSLQDGS